MTKELTPLEALKNLAKMFSCETPFWDSNMQIIESALKKLEKWENLKISEEEAHWLMTLISNPEGQLDKLKALEIIKKKMVDISMFYCTDVLSEYNDWARKHLTLLPPEKRELTKEEYNLLKRCCYD